jgi:DNA-binding transcriptional regulator YiaG
VEYLIKQYSLEQGALEIQYIEEFFNEFPRRKTADEIIQRLNGRDHLILMAEVPSPDDAGMLLPVSYKVCHELRLEETDPKLRDLVERLAGFIRCAGRRVLYSWIGGTRSDWRGRGHFRALTEEQEAWAVNSGFHEVLVKTRNRFYDMRGTLDSLRYDVVKFEPDGNDNRESKVYMSKQLGADVLRAHRSRLGLSAADFGTLVGVSAQSVYNWEGEKAQPRGEQLARLVAVREIGKREASQRLKQLATATGKGKTVQ